MAECKSRKLVLLDLLGLKVVQLLQFIMRLCRGFHDQRWFYESYDEGEVDCIVVTIERRRRRRMRMLKDVCEAA